MLHELRSFIHIGVTEAMIAERCVQLLEKYGVRECWYHNVPALVLVGQRTRMSVSGKQYRPADISVTDIDLVTVDLSPMLDGCWGDCARSFYIEGGRVVNQPENAEL